MTDQPSRGFVKTEMFEHEHVTITKRGDREPANPKAAQGKIRRGERTIHLVSLLPCGLSNNRESACFKMGEQCAT